MSAAIPVADMCSGTGELSVALQATIRAATVLTSLSDADSRSRAYLQDRFPTATIYADCRDQNFPDAAVVAVGAPCTPPAHLAAVHPHSRPTASRRPRAAAPRLRRVDDGPSPGGNAFADSADPARRQRGCSPPSGPHAHPRT